MPDAKSFDAAAGALAGICREAAKQNKVDFVAGMAFAQASLTQQTLRALIKHLAEMGHLNLAMLDAMTEQCFREQTAQMTHGPQLILPPGTARKQN